MYCFCGGIANFLNLIRSCEWSVLYIYIYIYIIYIYIYKYIHIYIYIHATQSLQIHDYPNSRLATDNHKFTIIQIHKLQHVTATHRSNKFQKQKILYYIIYIYIILIYNIKILYTYMYTCVYIEYYIYIRIYIERETSSKCKDKCNC